MINLSTRLKKLKIPILSIIVVTIAATIVATGFSTTNAWGPERPTYTNKKPADYATFNSITNNVAVGDERNFVRIREAGTSNEFVDELEVVPGHEYEVYIYYHNDAASDTNASGVGIATNTRMSSAYPTVVNTNERGMVSGIISWSYVTPSDPNNAKTGTVWDEAYVTSKTNGVVLRYKTGTATIHNGGEANGRVLPTALFTTEGTPIGYNILTGVLPGCAEYSGHVNYILVAENPGSSLDKQVSIDGKNWFNSITVKPGDIVTYKVSFENTGNTNFTNLIFTDSHDQDLILRSGSTKIYDYKHTNGYTIDDIIDISGFNTGDVVTGALVQATYQMQVRNDPSICGKTLNNTILAKYNSTEQKTDTTSVKVLCDDIPPTEEDCKTNPNLPGCEEPTEEECETNPDLPGCTDPTPTEEDCKTDPSLPGCEDIITPVKPTPEDCNKNPNLEGCNLPDSIVQTGPLEIAMAAVVIISIGGAGFYLYRTRRTLKTVEDVVSGPSNTTIDSPTEPTESTPATPVEPEKTTPTEPGDTPAAPAGFSQAAGSVSNPDSVSTSKPISDPEPTSEAAPTDDKQEQ